MKIFNIGSHMHVHIPVAGIKQFYYGKYMLQIDKNGKHLIDTQLMKTVKSKPLRGSENWRFNA